MQIGDYKMQSWLSSLTPNNAIGIEASKEYVVGILITPHYTHIQ